jgi:hypothetical protein
VTSYIPPLLVGGIAMRDPWPWYAFGLLIVAGLLYLAHHYEDNQLPRACRSLDMEATVEDAEVAVLDEWWSLPEYKKGEVA